ncbi:MAG: diguanylate cyclase domain-containing protein [Bilifractor sp.]
MQGRGTEICKRWIITGIVFMVCIAAISVFIRDVRRRTLAQMREVCRLNELARVSELNEDINRCKEITKTLDLLLQDSGNGEIRDFPSISREIMAGQNDVACLQLAKDGIITETYPERTGYSDTRNLFLNEESKEVCEYSKKSGAIMIQGPVKMKQGDPVIIVRNPVYIYGENGKKHFWGFAIAIIRVSKAFQGAMNSLSSFGYDYNLYKTNPLDTDYHLLNSSRENLENPVEVTFVNGSCTWKLDVMPKKGWSVTDSLRVYYYFGAAVSVLITAMAYMMLTISEDRKKFVLMSEHDGLTGLLNGRKFSEDTAEAAAKDRTDGSGFGIIYIDINCFKSINDRFGHTTGNDVLVETSRRMSAAVPYACYRLGGDEFAILVTDVLTEDGYRDVIRQIKGYFMAPVRIAESWICVSLSAGYALSPKDGTDPEKLRQAADKRMYLEKQEYHRRKEQGTKGNNIKEKSIKKEAADKNKK